MSCKIIPSTNSNNQTIVISFSGQGHGFGTIPQFEFVNFLNKHYPDVEKHFYLDTHIKWYHKGIDGISTNIDETIAYLKRIIAPFHRRIFIGSSAGGFGAILFGSVLNVETVIAFIPQTFVPVSTTGVGYNQLYVNLRPHINNTTQYYVYGDVSIDIKKDIFHHIMHCENIERGEGYENVRVNRDYIVDLREMRNSGELLKIMTEIIG